MSDTSFSKKTSLRIGFVAPSFQVPQAEFKIGLERLKTTGFEFQVHSQCRRSHLFFAGTDEERARAFFEYAQEPGLPILWCARGGYGAARILPYLEKMTAEQGLPPKKLLAGYSDSTALLDFVRAKWGWSALHSPMPGLRDFYVLGVAEWKSFQAFFRGELPAKPWGPKKLRFASGAPVREVEGELVGGNLSVVTSMIGTPHAIDFRGRLAFFEDVDESLYRIDRMIEQLAQAGSLSESKGIVLGNFLSCRDSVRNVLAKVPTGRNALRVIRAPKPSELKPARKKLDEKKAIPALFARLGHDLGIPVAFGLPVGHGPEKLSLPLGARYRLSRDGSFVLTHWDWAAGPS